MNDVGGCHGDGMIEEGVEMWPILKLLHAIKGRLQETWLYLYIGMALFFVRIM